MKKSGILFLAVLFSAQNIFFVHAAERHFYARFSTPSHLSSAVMSSRGSSALFTLQKSGNDGQQASPQAELPGGPPDQRGHGLISGNPDIVEGKRPAAGEIVDEGGDGGVAPSTKLPMTKKAVGFIHQLRDSLGSYKEKAALAEALAHFAKAIEDNRTKQEGFVHIPAQDFYDIFLGGSPHVDTEGQKIIVPWHEIDSKSFHIILAYVLNWLSKQSRIQNKDEQKKKLYALSAAASHARGAINRMADKNTRPGQLKEDVKYISRLITSDIPVPADELRYYLDNQNLLKALLANPYPWYELDGFDVIQNHLVVWMKSDQTISQQEKRKALIALRHLSWWWNEMAMANGGQGRKVRFAIPSTEKREEQTFEIEFSNKSIFLILINRIAHYWADQNDDYAGNVFNLSTQLGPLRVDLSRRHKVSLKFQEDPLLYSFNPKDLHNDTAVQPVGHSADIVAPPTRDFDALNNRAGERIPLSSSVGSVVDPLEDVIRNSSSLLDNDEGWQVIIKAKAAIEASDFSRKDYDAVLRVYHALGEIERRWSANTVLALTLDHVTQRLFQLLFNGQPAFTITGKQRSVELKLAPDGIWFILHATATWPKPFLAWNALRKVAFSVVFNIPNQERKFDFRVNLDEGLLWSKGPFGSQRERSDLFPLQEAGRAA